MITSFCVNECEGSSRMGSRPRRILFTGHSNGVVQIWDLSTALDMSSKAAESVQFLSGPTPTELLRLLEQCEVVASGASTPSLSPVAPATCQAMRVKASNMALLQQLQVHNHNEESPQSPLSSSRHANEDSRAGVNEQL